MFHLYKLQAKAWWHNPFAKTEFFTTTLFLLVIGSIVSMKLNDLGGTEAELSIVNIQLIASITVMMIMNGALFSFGFAFFEMKESVLLKRIGATNISKPKAIGSFVLWGLTTTAMIVLWIVVIVSICNAFPNNDILYISLNDVNWAGVIIAIIITAIAYLPIALFFVSISKNAEVYNIIVTFYFFIFVFLSGVLSPQVSRSWMTIIGYLTPMGWTNQLMSNSMIGYHVFNVANIGDIDDLKTSGSETIALGVGLFVVPIAFGVLSAGITTRTFKWD